ncbi:MAG: serine acetyltransferase [Bacteroidia bacterium]
MNSDFLNKLVYKHQETISCPSPKDVVSAFNHLLGLMFPEHSDYKISGKDELIVQLTKCKTDFTYLLSKALNNNLAKGQEISSKLFIEIEATKKKLDNDVESMFLGDPAAKSISEVIRTYPGFYAIAAYRIAHLLHEQDIPLIPRIITEHAHSHTGIDIHPGAQIGSHFCIDHGTGIVIGETTEIGDHVKLYQGVTLGALSVSKDQASSKRHPTIGNNVVIYARTTILGGNTTIGNNCIIGGNVWLTSSIARDTKVYYNINKEAYSNTEKLIYKTA